jgi:hypothetical protein
MSRSNPTAAGLPNPSTRFFEWSGGEGKLGYYDKEKKEMIEVKTPFRFLFLDQMATVKGYNKKRKTGLYANEVRDTKLEPLRVKFFEGKEDVATGLWVDIKDKVVASSGGFCANVYIAYKDGNELKIGSIAMKGCSLGPWFDFQKKFRKEMHEKSIIIKPGKMNDEGAIEFTPPIFEVGDITPETDARAKELDAELQKYFDSYFSRTTTTQRAEAKAETKPSEEPEMVDTETGLVEPDDDSSVPF